MRDMADRKTSQVYTARGPTEGEDWAAVASALNERMAARRVGQQQLAELSGVSVSTLRLLQHGAGRRVQNKTLAAIARALDWPDDQLLRVLMAETRTLDSAPSGTVGREILAALSRVEGRLTEIDARLAVVERELSGRRDLR